MTTFDELNEAMSKLRAQRIKLAESLWTKYSSFNHVISVEWECEKSPLNFCVYDRWEDRAHDNCLFCGDPEERK